jgi:putative nucleotidyltransferase with HDIG domain
MHHKRMLFSIASLVDLGQEATSSKDLSSKMKSALYVITGTLSVPTATIFAYSRKRKKLHLIVAKGYRDLGEDISLCATTKHVTLFKMNDIYAFRDMSESAFFKLNKNILKKLQAIIFLPLFAKGEFVGAITLGRKLGGAPYRRWDKDVLRVIAHQMAITLHSAQLFIELSEKVQENRKLYKNMQRIYYDTIQAFAAAIDAKDGYTKDHSYRVASYAAAIAKELGWRKKDIEGIYVAGLLHDIGKIIIDTSLIRKDDKLTAVELNEIRKHPQISYDILSKINFPWKNIKYFVRHHHERMDGKGYPDALLSPELSEGVKILILADAFDAMTTDRPYRHKLKLDETLHEVARCCGTQFDERITKTLSNLLLRELSGEVTELQLLPLLKYGEASDITALEVGISA